MSIERGSGDYNSLTASQETSERIQQSSYRNYIPASAFTDDNDPYKHVRHAMWISNIVSNTSLLSNKNMFNNIAVLWPHFEME